MRVIVFFDLPTTTYEHTREYTKFRKMLINNGFFMMQKSVYCKMALNEIIVKSIKQKIENNKPKTGLVQILTITEKQFSKMDYICGENSNSMLDTTKRFTIL